MSTKRIVGGSAFALGILATSVVLSATTASADGWSGRHDRHGRYGVSRPDYHGRYSDYGYSHRRSSDRTGERIAKGIIIGVGAALVGAILSDAARAERRHNRYDRYDD
jgi:hypothetical protein